MNVPKLKKLPESAKRESMPMEEGMDNRPNFELTETMFPEIKNWKVGEKYTVMMELEQTGSKIKEYGSDKGKIAANLKIVKIAECDMNDDEEEMEEYAAGGTVSPEKAKIMLSEGTVNGKKLSPKQKKYFGWIAGGKKKAMGGYAMGGPVLNANSGEKMHNAMSGVPFEKMNKWEEATRGEVKGTEKIDNMRPTKVVTDDQVYGIADRRPGFAKGGAVPKATKAAKSGDSSVKSPTRTSTEVKSPTSTKTSTEAYTADNVTVTGGAGDGDTTVTLNERAKKDKKKYGGKVHNAMSGVPIYRSK